MFVYQLHESCNYQHLDCVLQLYALMLWDNGRLYALSSREYNRAYMAVSFELSHKSIFGIFSIFPFD